MEGEDKLEDWGELTILLNLPFALLYLSYSSTTRQERG